MHADTATTVTTDDGARLHTITAGDPDARLTVVLCHGYMLDRTTWHLQLPALGQAARLVLYDQRGHGRSTLGTSPVTTDRLGEDLHQVLAATASHGPVVLVGHSMGGMAVMALAATHPDLFGTRVTGAALLSTSAGQLNGTPMGLPPAAARLLHLALAVGLPRLARLPRAVDTVRRRTGPFAFRVTRPLLYRAPVDPAAAQVTIRAMSRVPITTVAACYPALMAHDQLAALPALGRCPVLVAVGTSDQITPVAHSASLASRIPSAELVVVPRASHLLPLERPHEVNKLLLALVSRSTAALTPGAAAHTRSTPGDAQPPPPVRRPGHVSAEEPHVTALPHPYAVCPLWLRPSSDDWVPHSGVVPVRPRDGSCPAFAVCRSTTLSPPVLTPGVVGAGHRRVRSSSVRSVWTLAGTRVLPVRRTRSPVHGGGRNASPKDAQASHQWARFALIPSFRRSAARLPVPPEAR
ncbi:alpha/beta hydrolase [Streptomyces sp. S.PB5]|uniref:alpha/beta fold hydrolase n=1 Tax=Streptomyces sp. S.PB5 TaxID=3020844 RepID=UPI0025AFF883|nr:alpha/beta hydrolase [Streptomyces sp. S.PB5]MDN3028994.1 alpha/beta hydrolase [Streptomyces sp. S.PB5]